MTEQPIKPERLVLKQFLVQARGLPVANWRQWWDRNQAGTLTIVDGTTGDPLVGNDDWYVHFARGSYGAACDPWPMDGYDFIAKAFPEPRVPGPPGVGGGRPLTYVDCPAVPTVEHSDTSGSQGNPVSVPLTITGGDCLYAAILYVGLDAGSLTATWRPSWVSAGDQGAGEAMTLIASETVPLGGDDTFIGLYRLLNPTPSVTGGSAVVFDADGGGHAVAWSLVDVDQSAPEIDTDTGAGTASSSSGVSVTPGLVLDFVGWIKANATMAAPTPTAGQTVSGTDLTDRGFGSADLGSGAGYGSSGVPTWSFGAAGSSPFLAVGVSVRAA